MNVNPRFDIGGFNSNCTCFILACDVGGLNWCWRRSQIHTDKLILTYDSLMSVSLKQGSHYGLFGPTPTLEVGCIDSLSLVSLLELIIGFLWFWTPRRGRSYKIPSVCMYRVFFLWLQVFDHSYIRTINCIFGQFLRGFYYSYVPSCEPNSFSMASFFGPTDFGGRSYRFTAVRPSVRPFVR